MKIGAYKTSSYNPSPTPAIVLEITEEGVTTTRLLSYDEAYALIGKLMIALTSK